VQALSSGSPHAANGQSARQPAQQQQQQQQPTMGVSRIHKLNLDRTCPNWIRTRKLIPRPPHEQKSKFQLIFEMCGPEVIVNIRYINNS
jgi:hypothetical protein